MAYVSHLVLNKLVLLCRHWLVSDSTTLGEDLNPEENLTRLTVASGSENWGQRVRASSERLASPRNRFTQSRNLPLTLSRNHSLLGGLEGDPIDCLPCPICPAEVCTSEVLFAWLDNLHQFSCCLKMTTIALMLSTLCLFSVEKISL